MSSTEGEEPCWGSPRMQQLGPRPPSVGPLCSRPAVNPFWAAGFGSDSLRNASDASIRRDRFHDAQSLCRAMMAAPARASEQRPVGPKRSGRGVEAEAEP